MTKPLVFLSSLTPTHSTSESHPTVSFDSRLCRSRSHVTTRCNRPNHRMRRGADYGEMVKPFSLT